MTNIELKYNFGTKECAFSDGTRTEDDFISSKSGSELSLWCGELLLHLVDTYNEDIALTFTGIERDCDTMADAVERFNEKSDKKIRPFTKKILRQNENAESGSKIEKLKDFYRELTSESCPFDEIRNDKDIENAFNTALNSDFEIAVVATMSSGKSTLINAMLGNELLPARNEATTATIAKIYDDDNADHFWGESYDKDDNLIGERVDPLSLDNMNRLNDNPAVSEIKIHGNIVGISSQSMKLVLTDTPGPNNSRTDEHKNHTYRLIKEKYKPMILYILNGTQLETNDDNLLLKDIAAAMSEGNRQASDRFIFVLNKADEFDSEKESVAKKIDDTKRYLAEHGIKNPKVFPCSSYFAKLIRQFKAGVEFTKKEKIDLRGKLGLFNEEEDMHFSDMAEVSANVRAKLDAEIAKAKSTNDEYAEALIHTGIPAVEATISEYLEKYAQPQKITEALHSFLQTINDLGAEAKETGLLKDNSAKIEETKVAIARIKEAIENGHKGEELKAKIEALNVDEALTKEFEELSGEKIGDFISEARKKYCDDKITIEETKDRVGRIQKDLETLRNRFAIDIENLINEKIGDEAQKYMDEYNGYVSDLLGSAFGHEVKSASILGNLAAMKLDSSSLSDFEFSVKEKTGTYIDTETRTRTEMRTKQRTGTRKKSGLFSGVARFFGNLLNTDWGYEDYTYTEEVPVQVKYEVQVEKDKFENRQYVNFTKMFNNIIAAKLDDFGANARKLAFSEAKKQEQALKEAFNASFDELNQKIRGKMDEMQRTLDDKEELERKVRESEKKLAWLSDFKSRLNKMFEA